ncbi:MAG: class I SAM-dependent methyltransferase [Rhodobacteraceae bacterium]|nr:class I SAM-dependent methyltransferase [Paracoccaceae bacterium]
MTISKDDYVGWDTKSHLQTFDGWNKQLNPTFNFMYGCFAEQKYLRSTVLAHPQSKILDVGCATGTTYRFLRNALKKDPFDYLGVDLSTPAVERAKSLYPEGDFRKKGHEKLLDFVGEKRDVVFSRDTVMHQTEPYNFLTELLEVTGRFLILRLRTRDHGPTVRDVERSCQMHYDSYWMPYIVLNIEELLEFLKSFPGVSNVVVNRSYEILGGQNFRYLPKELYFSEAGGAETSVLIEFSQGDAEQGTEIVYDNTLEGHAYLRKYRLRRYVYSALSRLAGR